MNTPNTPDADPTLDRRAAARWMALADSAALQGGPWLHAEVGRRMAEKLEWITAKPTHWLNWRPLVGSLEAQVLVGPRYPDASCIWGGFEPLARMDIASNAIKKIVKPWWHPVAWRAPRQSRIVLRAPAQASVQMLWANMSLHHEPDVRATIERWHSLIATDGFLMFSCVGPDTCRELRGVYNALGWGPVSSNWTDMHDWGDRLVRAGFAEPVMDMEHITLTFASPERALAELRGLGRNLHPGRFPALRGRRWRERLLTAIGEQLSDDQGRIALTFEIIYGHAFKPAPRIRLASESSVSIEQMREMLGRPRGSGGAGP